MERALFHAERGRGRTTPNPIVGAVVVSPDGVVVGQGAHLQAGGPHAEIVALGKAGAAARGATLYCTLEPCSHTGRTGPCVEAIVAAGIRRVVVAAGDPNPRVAGRGFAYLRQHQIDVTEDVGRAAATRQLRPFFTWVEQRRPFLTLKTATTADGFVGRPGERVAITGDVANRYFHRQRAEVDAIAVGANTVLADDPLLTAREVYRFRPLARVIVDWRARVPSSARVFSTLRGGPVIMVVLADVLKRTPEYLAGLVGSGVAIETFETLDLGAVAARLAARELMWVLVEGGPALQNAFVEAGLVDRIQWVQSPDALGAGVPMSTALAAQAARLRPVVDVRLGRDWLREFDVHGIG